MLGSRWQLRSEFSDTSDGEIKKLSIVRPFYSLDSTWSLGLTTDQSDLLKDVYIPQDGDTETEAEEYQNRHAKADIFVGWSDGLVDGMTRRWSIGLTNEEEHFVDDTGVTIDGLERQRTYPWLERQWVEDQFTVLENLYQMHRTEDIPLGLNLRTRLGYAASEWDTARNGESLSEWVYQTEVSHAISDGNHHLFQTQALLNGAWRDDVNTGDNILLTLKTEYHHLDDSRFRTYIKWQLDQGHDLTADMLLPLGGEDSLRGYPQGSYYGDQRQLLVLEQRYFSDAHWFNLIRVGAAAFVETGRTLLGDNRDLDSPWMTDAGIGLRLSSSKALSGTVVHLDLAFPMTDRDQYAPRQWTVTTKETF